MPRRSPLLRRLSLLALILAPVPALAADPATTAGLGSAALRTTAALGAVLLLIAVLAYLVRRLKNVAPAAGPGRRILSAGRLDLGGRREIRLVDVGDRRLVIGITAERIELLTELEPGECRAESSAPSGSPRSGALEVLRKLATS